MTENIILKLSSGEEIVCRLVEDTQSGMIQITNPLLVSTTPRVTFRTRGVCVSKKMDTFF